MHLACQGRGRVIRPLRYVCSFGPGVGALFQGDIQRAREATSTYHIMSSCHSVFFFSLKKKEFG